jgi:hypothetical protein
MQVPSVHAIALAGGPWQWKDPAGSGVELAAKENSSVLQHTQLYSHA